MIQIKTPHEIELMRASTGGRGRARRREGGGSGVSTGELDAVAEDYIRSQGPCPTSWLPRVHRHDLRVGQPRDRARDPQPGATAGSRRQHLDRLRGDPAGLAQRPAVTVTVGEPSAEDAALMDVTERSMWAGLAKAIAGGRLTDISAAVEQTITAESHPYGIVDHYGGHGIGTEMHQDPHVLNFGRSGRGPKLVLGLVLAIEPMVTVGDPATVELEDGWTVITKDGSRAAHFEHTVAITPEARGCSRPRTAASPAWPRRPGSRPAASQVDGACRAIARQTIAWRRPLRRGTLGPGVGTPNCRRRDEMPTWRIHRRRHGTHLARGGLSRRAGHRGRQVLMSPVPGVPSASP